MFTKIGTILPGTVEKNGMAPKLARARVFVVFEETARRCLPSGLSQAFKPLQATGGTLTVACKTAAAAAALRAAERELRQALSDAGSDVERFRFLLAPWR
jgi:hypothetical protein